MDFAQLQNTETIPITVKQRERADGAKYIPVRTVLQIRCPCPLIDSGQVWHSGPAPCHVALLQ